MCPLPPKVIGVVYQATLSPLDTCCTPPRQATVQRAPDRLSSMNKRPVGHHTIQQQLCILHNSSTIMAVREDQYILIVSGAAHAPHHSRSSRGSGITWWGGCTNKANHPGASKQPGYCKNDMSRIEYSNQGIYTSVMRWGL